MCCRHQRLETLPFDITHLAEIEVKAMFTLVHIIRHLQVTAKASE